MYFKLLLCGMIFFYCQVLSAQVLETEESNPLAPNQFEIGAAVEFQTSKAGTETAIPIGMEYGLSKRLTLLLEPVAYTNIHNKIGRSATGLGDLEITLFYQLNKESHTWPAISLSAEVKLPTSKDTLIGTGKTDFTPFIIASKTLGKFYTSLNLSYTFLGKPAGVEVANLFNYALGSIYTLSPKDVLFGEVYGNTSAFGADVPEPANGTVTTEISSGELVTAIGYGRYIRSDLLLSFGVSHDNNNAFLFRPGIEWSFGKKRIKIH